MAGMSWQDIPLPEEMAAEITFLACLHPGSLTLLRPYSTYLFSLLQLAVHLICPLL
jgi:hypothetical protein